MALGVLALVIIFPALLLARRPAGGGAPWRLPRGLPWLGAGIVLHLGWLDAFSQMRGAPEAAQWLPLGAEACIALFIIANRRFIGARIVIVGLALNAAAMLANGGLMPITLANVPGPHTPQRFDGDRLLRSADRVTPAGAPLGFLGDAIYLGARGGGAAVSVGDLIILGGSVVIVVQLARSGMASNDDDSRRSAAADNPVAATDQRPQPSSAGLRG